MKYIVKTIFVLFSVFLVYYSLLPSIGFPQKLPDSLQSQEPADIEDKSRRAYFINYERDAVMDYYSNNFSLKWVRPIRLNYPPEEAQLIIRDQTRSTFLEELVFPFRESVYINGFKPDSAKDAVIVDNKVWVQKVTIKYVSSSAWARLLVGISILSIMPSLFILLSGTVVSILSELRRISLKIYE